MNEALQSHSNYHAYYTAYIIIATVYNTGNTSTIIGPDYVINALVICFIVGTTIDIIRNRIGNLSRERMPPYTIPARTPC